MMAKPIDTLDTSLAAEAGSVFVVQGAHDRENALSPPIP
jgi:hypothetical protein